MIRYHYKWINYKIILGEDYENNFHTLQMLEENAAFPAIPS